MKCKHCGKEIKHYAGQLYHEIGAVVFPQYCETRPDSPDYERLIGQLHEPLEESPGGPLKRTMPPGLETSRTGTAQARLGVNSATPSGSYAARSDHIGCLNPRYRCEKCMMRDILDRQLREAVGNVVSLDSRSIRDHHSVNGDGYNRIHSFGRL